MAGEGPGAAAPQARRLGVVSLGFLRQARLRRMLALSGWRVVPGWSPCDAIGVWGRRGVARRGLAAARLRGLPVVTLEDAFLRSLRPGVTGEPPVGLLIDETGCYYDASAPSRLETLLETGELPDGAAGLALWRRLGLSKVNDWAGREADLPPPGFVLVADQAQGDASIGFGGATPASFRRMLEAARDENPGARILIRTHPDVALGRRRGHFGPGDARGGVGFLAPDHPPAALFARAARVYCVTSQLGFEAILHGHRPRLFGLPFYAGWGLAEEEVACPRRSRARTAAELFAAAMLAAPVWYDPFADALTGFATAAVQMAERAAAWRENAVPTIATGMRLWKRPAVRGFLAGPAPLAFEDRPARAVARARASGGRIIVWAGREGPALAAAAAAAGVPLLRMEDGFLRSVGLGARLVAPASLVLDDLGIYYDPARPSRLEALIAASAGLPEAALARAAALRAAIVAGGVGKYNVGKAAGFAVPSGRRVLLVPGQVEDDAGLLRAAGAVRTNAALLRAARDAAPDAFLIWKPHPDVEAGLRPGAVDAAGIADAVATDADAATLLALAHEVWTISSLMGFEALLRGLTVTCLGAPFYAGWGLTRDLGPVPSRRTARPPLDGLVHAALIAYPRYRDPVTGLACAPEIVVSRLAARDPRLGRAPSRIARLLAAGQERLGGAAWLWR